MIDAALLLTGLLLALFIPGFLLTCLLSREEGFGSVEALTYSIALSLAIDIALGLFLGASSVQKELTGGITGSNIWGGLFGISCILLAALIIKTRSARS
jgi:uncharacterized membrane protein